MLRPANPRLLSSLAFPLALALGSPAPAATITVDTLNDGTTADGDCTLREAIINANGNDGSQPDCAAGTGDDRIEFSVAGTLTVSSTLPQFSDQMFTTVIDGGDAITVSGGGSEQVFNSGADVDLHLLKLTVTDAVSPASRGGGLVMGTQAEVLIRNCIFENNSSQLAGGAIGNLNGILVIENSVFRNNECIDCSGGALHSDLSSAEVTIRDSLFRDNIGGGPLAGGRGGAILQKDGGTTTIENTDFFGNEAGQGGAISNEAGPFDSRMIISGATLQDNHGAQSGGAIFNNLSSLEIHGSEISGGNEAFNGGAIANVEGGTITIADTEIADNFSQGSGAGIFDFGGGDITLRRTLVANNETRSSFDRDGGGAFIDSGGSLTVINSTFSGNEAIRNGGGIVNFNAGMITIVKSTITGNSAAEGGGISNDDEVFIKDSIISGNTGGDCETTNFTNVEAQGLNLDSDGTCEAAANDTTGTGGNIDTADPMLGPLADNGGPTRTHALQSGSPAIDTAPDCGDQDGNPLATDQRSMARPQDGDGDGAATCDIGAFELARAGNETGNGTGSQVIPALSVWSLLLLILGTIVGAFPALWRGR